MRGPYGAERGQFGGTSRSKRRSLDKRAGLLDKAC